MSDPNQPELTPDDKAKIDLKLATLVKLSEALNDFGAQWCDDPDHWPESAQRLHIAMALLTFHPTPHTAIILASILGEVVDKAMAILCDVGKEG